MLKNSLKSTSSIFSSFQKFSIVAPLLRSVGFVKCFVPKNYITFLPIKRLESSVIEYYLYYQFFRDQAPANGVDRTMFGSAMLSSVRIHCSDYLLEIKNFQTSFQQRSSPNNTTSMTSFRANVRRTELIRKRRVQ